MKGCQPQIPPAAGPEAGREPVKALACGAAVTDSYTRILVFTRETDA